MAKSLKENDDFYDVCDRNEDFFGQLVRYYEDGKEGQVLSRRWGMQ